MAHIEVVDGNIGWDERYFPAPPSVPGYAPRELNEHERAIEQTCARLIRGEASARMVCDTVEVWARSCTRIPDFASPRHIDVIARYARMRVLKFIERKYSPFAIVDETRTLLKTAGLDPG